MTTNTTDALAEKDRALEAQRAEFEAWAAAEGDSYGLGKDANGDYSLAPTAFAWLAWQAATNAMRQHGEWLPIESAPDKTLVVIAWVCPSTNVWKYRVSDRHQGVWYGFDSPYTLNYMPTHWMPLPPPPTGEK